MSGNPVTAIEDDEHLYRRVPDDPKLYKGSTGGDLVHLSASAFNDRCKRPSVDRATLRGSDPLRSCLDDSDGVVSLIAAEVRKVKVDQLDAKQKPVRTHDIDVLHRPEPHNYAHAQVEPAPSIETNTTFHRLKERLARLAEARGWTVVPGKKAGEQGLQ